MEKTEKLSFEDSMQRIEDIVRALEKGDRSLDEALGLFEEGTMLIKGASGMLEAAEQKIVRLQKGPDGEPIEHNFIEEGDT